MKSKSIKKLALLSILTLPFSSFVGTPSLAIDPGQNSQFVNGELFYTRHAGGDNVKKVNYSYDGNAFTLDGKKTIARTEGADGIIFAPDGDLLIGGQGDRVHKVNPESGQTKTVTAGGANVFHLALDPSGSKVWAGGIPGDLSEVPLNPFANGVIRKLTGDDTRVTHIAFDQLGNAFYTASSSDGVGSFGTIDLNSFATKRIYENLPAAHGMVFDEYTGDLILCGDNHITQINPKTKKIVADREFGNIVSTVFDQGAVDGKGHLFVATNDKDILFMDYSSSKKIDAHNNFYAFSELDTHLDDVAPLSGPGSKPIDQTPPTLNIQLDQNILWPPNHKMVPIHVTIDAKDFESGIESVILTSITSNEPDEGLGDGHTNQDIQNAEFGKLDTSFDLRAERSGKTAGRVYTIIYTATDKAGNQTTATTTVTVPHDLGKHSQK